MYVWGVGSMGACGRASLCVQVRCVRKPARVSMEGCLHCHLVWCGVSDVSLVLRLSDVYGVLLEWQQSIKCRRQQCLELFWQAGC